MADILFDFPIEAPAARVFESVSKPEGSTEPGVRFELEAGETVPYEKRLDV